MLGLAAIAYVSGAIAPGGAVAALPASAKRFALVRGGRS